MAEPTGRNVVLALMAHGADVEREVTAELGVVAQLMARTARRLAPKAQSTLVNSIRADQDGPAAWTVSAGVEYSQAVEDGIKPGGKGLPRFFDTASKSIVDWLQGRAFAGQHKPRKGSKALAARELELRDRYEGLAWHIRNFGVKAQPFFGPAVDEIEPVFFDRLAAAANRAMDARGGATA